MRVDLGRSGRPNSTRVLCIVAAMALLAGAALGVARPLGEAHAATACTKHTKRVIKHVKRHGKRKRVVRIKHYWTCPPAPVPTPSAPAQATPPAATPPTEPPAATPKPEPEPEANAVSVIAREGPYSYVPSRPSVRSGRVTVQLNNQGADPHDMAIQRVGEAGLEGEEINLPITPGRSQTTETVELQPGTYRMWCTLYHHAEEGMETTITVK
jgi:plastocyanin